MEFLQILNDYTLTNTFKKEQFHTYIYDSSEIYYGEIYEIDHEFYIEFILNSISTCLGHAVFKFFECRDKTELTERMPSVVNFIKFVNGSLLKMGECIDNKSIKNMDVNNFRNLLEKDSNLIFIGADKFIQQYLAYNSINIR